MSKAKETITKDIFKRLAKDYCTLKPIPHVEAQSFISEGVSLCLEAQCENIAEIHYVLNNHWYDTAYDVLSRYGYFGGFFEFGNRSLCPTDIRQFAKKFGGRVKRHRKWFEDECQQAHEACHIEINDVKEHAV